VTFCGHHTSFPTIFPLSFFPFFFVKIIRPHFITATNDKERIQRKGDKGKKGGKGRKE